MRSGLGRVLAGVIVAGFSLGFSVAAWCAAKTDYNHNVDFSKYHTYTWGTISMPGTSAGGTVKHSVDVQLQAKGWKLVQTGADTTVFATGKITGNQDTEEFYHSMGGGWGGVWGWNGWSWSQGYGGATGPGGLASVTTTKVTKHKKGNLEIDIFETGSKDLVWRGIASGKTKDLQMELATMFVDFPPKPGQRIDAGATPPEGQ